MRIFEKFATRTHPLDDQDTFALFYENTHQNTYRYVMALNGGFERQAEDITADAYLRAWKNRRSFTGTSDAAFGWLLTITRRIIIDKYRAASSRPTEADLIDYIEDDKPDAETVLLGKEVSEQVIKALQYLPENRRDMVVLRYMLGWRVNQIAEHLAMPENTVSVSLHRSLKQLQEALALQGVSNERTA
ncbi:MAG: sigma-70 family RNA polymerase sigma factor [Anaerolineaceae bacterium]